MEQHVQLREENVSLKEKCKDLQNNVNFHSIVIEDLQEENLKLKDKVRTLEHTLTNERGILKEKLDQLESDFERLKESQTSVNRYSRSNNKNHHRNYRYK